MEKSLHGDLLINILLINLSVGDKTACDLQAAFCQAERDRGCMTHCFCSRRAWRERMSGKSGVQVTPGQEGASNSVFSPVAMSGTLPPWRKRTEAPQLIPGQLPLQCSIMN